MRLTVLSIPGILQFPRIYWYPSCTGYTFPVLVIKVKCFLKSSFATGLMGMINQEKASEVTLHI